MKRFLSALLVLSMVCGTFSCTKDPLQEPEDDPTDQPSDEPSDEPTEKELTFTASFEKTFSPGAKSVIVPGEEDSELQWAVGDKVSVFPIGYSTIYEFAATTAGASTTLSGTAMTSTSGYYALYPADATALFDGANLISTLPAEQAAVLNGLSYNLAVTQAVNNEMLFKNVVGLVHLTVDLPNVTSIEFKGNSDEVVAGKVTISGVTAEPAWSEVGEGAKSVKLLPATGATALEQGDYYFSVLPQTFSAGYTITATIEGGDPVVYVVSSQRTISRSNGTSIGSLTHPGVAGKGTESDPYRISTVDDLAGMADLLVDGTPTYYKLMTDLDMSGVTEWAPINLTYPYKVFHFDGNNKTISNFTGSAEKYASMFGVVIGSIKNLTFVDPTINAKTPAGLLGSTVGTTSISADEEAGTDAVEYPRTVVQNLNVSGLKLNLHSNDKNVEPANGGSNRIGGLAGMADNADFIDVQVSLEVVDVDNDGSYPSQIGGLVGRAIGTASTFTRCSTSGVVIANEKAGGILGYGYCEGIEMTGCSSSAIITAPNRQTGGLVGYTKTLKITDSYATGAVTSTSGAYAGGIAGVVEYDLQMKGSYARGDVSGNGGVGGAIGCLDRGEGSVIENSYAEGDVLNKGGHWTGGFIGLINNTANTSSTGFLTITNCHATGDVEATGSRSHHGGFIGGIDKGNAATITKCYSTGDVTVNHNYAGAFIGSANVTNTAGPGFIIKKSYCTGNLHVATANKTIMSAFIAVPDMKNASSNGILIEDCYSTGDVTTVAGTSRFFGGIVAAFQSTNASQSTTNVTISRCFASGSIITGTAGAVGGLVGVMKTNNMASDKDKNLKMVKCISWCPEVSTAATDIVRYSAGAIIGAVNVYSELTDCYRRSDMTFKDCAATSTTDPTPVTLTGEDLFNQDNSSNSVALTFPSTFAATANKFPYHGKAAAADATISSVATSLGWPTDTWDLSGDVPALK